ncbi:hypothetical protein D3C86_2142660 [compost metagenome]
MHAAAVAGRGIGIFLGGQQGDKLFDIFRRDLGIDHQYVGHGGYIGNGHEIAQGLVLQIFIQAGVDGIGTGRP